ncbi:MAG TPA: hypothetical protein VKE51_00515 [Vicinamibacterales bacterium]|nr:hypothetical protein [Vicinamibacterales bacterium]
MTLFDVLFIGLFLTAVASVFVAAGAAITGRRRTASTILRRLIVGSAAYLAVVYAVALASPGRRLALGEDDCSDDWCIAVVESRAVAGTDVATIEVTFRVSSRARRVSQRERGVLVYLRDDRGRRVEAAAGPNDVPFDVRLEPRETVLTRRRFALEKDASPRTITLTRSGVPFPACLIIGEATALLHPTTVTLERVGS